MKLYLRLLDVVFRWCWLHVPWFADYCVFFVRDVEQKIHGAILRPDVIARAREMIGK